MADKVDAKIAKLRKKIEHHNQLYYGQARQEISDEAYDQLIKTLTRLETEIGQTHEQSPTQTVGVDLTEGFAKIEHAKPMYSIDNTYSEADLRGWATGVAKRLGEARPKFVCEPKVDGLAISLRYENGELLHAVTRGDGRRGDDVTANVRTIRNVPKQLTSSRTAVVPDVLEVRGEIYLNNDDFAEINKELRQTEEQRSVEARAAGKTIVTRTEYANPRNFAAGTLKQKDPAVTASRPLRFVSHGFGVVDPPQTDSYFDTIELLQKFGLPTGEDITLVETIEDVIEQIKLFETKRHSLPFNTDGMVVKVDSAEQREQLGYTSKSPRWVIAYKYPAEKVKTVLEEVTWQVGKNGTMTPVAELRPVLVAGTTVRRATLHNIVNIEKLDLHCGDSVLIEKAGEIIPQVLSADPTGRAASAKEIKPPKKCPSCEQRVEREPDGPHIYCVNPACPAQLLERLKHFSGRKQMNIDGLGERLLEQLIESNAVASIPDLYRLDQQAIAGLTSVTMRVDKDGAAKESVRQVGQKTAASIMKSLEASKSRGLAALLSGLGARFLGSTNGRKLAAWAGDVDQLLNASVAQIRTAISDATDDNDETSRKSLAAAIVTALENRPTLVAPVETDAEDLLLGLRGLSTLARRLSDERIARLSATFITPEQLVSADVDAVADSLKDNGRTAETLYDFFQSESGRGMINELRELGVVMTADRAKKAPADGPLKGKTVVVTGTLPTLGRAEAEELIASLGGKAGSGVSGKTSLVLAGESAGSKLEKARSLGIEVVDEAEFLKRFDVRKA